MSTRNWGKEAQHGALMLALHQAGVAYQVKNNALWLTAALPGREPNQPALPFVNGSCADLVHVRRGRWEAHHVFTGQVLARGVSVRDLVARTVHVVCLGAEPAEPAESRDCA